MQPALLRRSNGTIGHIIATREDSGWPLFGRQIKESIRAHTPGEGHKIAFANQGGVKGDARLVQRIAVPLIAVMRYLVLEGTLDMSDTAMAQANQVASSFVSPHAVIDTEPGRALWRNALVVEKNNRKLGERKFCRCFAVGPGKTARSPVASRVLTIRSMTSL